MKLRNPALWPFTSETGISQVLSGMTLVGPAVARARICGCMGRCGVREFSRIGISLDGKTGSPFGGVPGRAAASMYLVRIVYE